MKSNRIWKSVLVCIVLIVALLFVPSCGGRPISDEEANDYITATALRDNGRRQTFVGSVNAVGEYSLTLVPDERSEFSGKGEVRVAVSGSDPVLDADGNKIALSDLEIGDRVRITYNGEAFGSDPIRISQCYEVQKLE